MMEWLIQRRTRIFFISTQYTDSGNIHDTLEDIGARGLFPILFQFVGT